MTERFLSSFTQSWCDLSLCCLRLPQSQSRSSPPCPTVSSTRASTTPSWCRGQLLQGMWRTIMSTWTAVTKPKVGGCPPLSPYPTCLTTSVPGESIRPWWLPAVARSTPPPGWSPMPLVSENTWWLCRCMHVLFVSSFIQCHDYFKSASMQLIFLSSSEPTREDWILDKKHQLHCDPMAARPVQSRLLALCGDLCPIQRSQIEFHQ